MFLYLGEKVTGLLPEKDRIAKNKLRKWRYGYHEQIDTVVISKDGTLGDIYEVQGLKIGFPEMPKPEDTINYKVPERAQKWVREEIPFDLTDKGIAKATMGLKEAQAIKAIDAIYAKHSDFIERQFRMREEGVWIYIKGIPIYVPGTYWYGVNYVRESSSLPSFRMIQNELMIFWEACKADERCFGMQYVKNRRMGASLLAIMELLESGTITEDKLLGIISKKGDDAKKIFRRLVNAFRRLPPFFKPITDGTTAPKTNLVFDEPTRKRKAGEHVVSGEGLSTMIEWHNTQMNAMDGDAIFRSLIDECFAPGTKIMMSDMTFKNIEDIEVGDFVMVEGGKVRMVARTMSGESEMFKVVQPYEKDYVVNERHRLYLEQRCNVSSIHDDGIKIMTPQEYLNLGKYRLRTTYGVRSQGIELPEQEVPIDPHIFGLWLGDGDKDMPRFSVNTADNETVDSIVAFCNKNNYAYSVKDTHTENCKLYSILREHDKVETNGRWNKNKFTQTLKSLGVFKNKNIPDVYIRNSSRVRLELLAGILDSDGHLMHRNNSYRYEVSSHIEELAKQYELLARSLGFKVTLRERTTNLKTKSWNVYIGGDLSKIPCRVKRKKVPKDYVRQYADHINKIDVIPIGKGKYHGIQLLADNDDDRRLILEDFTLSMNCGKYPPEVPFSEYWPIVKTSHRKGISITGKAMCVSTVNSFKAGGAEYYAVYQDSDLANRDENGRTKSGLYRIFIPAKFCLEGMFDEYGFSIVKDPEKPVKTDEGRRVTFGAETWLHNEGESLKHDPEKYNEFKRQFPDTIMDAFRDSSGDCEFNLIKLQEQIEYNDVELGDVFVKNADEWRGNDDVERGNLVWVDGIKFSDVMWIPDPDNGRFYIKRGCHPPLHYRNKREYRLENGTWANGPIAGHVGCFGVDPYNRSKTSDGRGSKGAIILMTASHLEDELPKSTMILEYIDRPRKVEIFFEDVLKAAIYYSMPFLSELSNERFLAYVKESGFRHYSMNNPFKSYRDLNPTEKEYGGAPQQDAKIGDAQFYATESFVENHVGVARDDSFRMTGDMGDMPFTRTLFQLKDVDTTNRTKYDAYIAFSLALLGCQKPRKQKIEKPEPIPIPFDMYDNSGMFSKIL